MVLSHRAGCSERACHSGPITAKMGNLRVPKCFQEYSVGVRHGGRCLPIIQHVKARSSYTGNSRPNSDIQESKQASRGGGGRRKEGRGDKDREFQMPNRSLPSLWSSVDRSRAVLGISLFERQWLASVPHESTLSKWAWWQRPILPVTWEA